MSPDYDVFVSYAHEDAAWVNAFVRRLREDGLRVAYDALVLGPGDLVVHSLEPAILTTAAGVVVFSEASAASPWVHGEYAALMRRAAEDERRFIPVKIEDVELPAFAAERPHLDFQKDAYDELIGRLVRALRR